ncbi:MAG: hypothetical protein JNL35_17100 [Sphingopyxis sp.]|nr:hypothetical protein [Sphingopyxis sp.]
MNSRYDENWSDEELEACVSQYADAVRRYGFERAVAKDLFVSRALKQVPGRTEGAVQYRMGNISAVLEARDKPYLSAWKPMRNVGAGSSERIAGILKKYDLI